jgi:hypothetical protein
MSIDHIEQWLLFLPEACYGTNTGTVIDTTNGIKKCAFKIRFQGRSNTIHRGSGALHNILIPN